MKMPAGFFWHSALPLEWQGHSFHSWIGSTSTNIAYVYLLAFLVSLRTKSIVADLASLFLPEPRLYSNSTSGLHVLSIQLHSCIQLRL